MSTVRDLALAYLADRLEQIQKKDAFADCLPDIVLQMNAVKVTMPTEHMMVVEVFSIDQHLVDTLLGWGWEARRPVVLHGHTELTLSRGFGQTLVFKEQCQACYERGLTDPGD